MSNSNCCFLTFKQASQGEGKVVWYSHLFKNSVEFVVIHTVKDVWLCTKMHKDFFAAKDAEALYSQQKQDQELTVAQTMIMPN